MARIKYGSLVSEISGSIGSATFQKSSFGNTLRTKPNPRKSSSPIQMQFRAVMMRLHNEWHALYLEQRASWDQFISYSQGTIRRDSGILLTGHALYIKYNFLRAMNGQLSISDPVYYPMDPLPDIDSIKVDATHMYFYIDPTTAGLNVHLVLRLSNPRKSSISFTWRGLRVMELDDTGQAIWAVHSQFEDIFGALAELGDTLHYSMQWYCLDSPIISRPRTGIIVCTAYP